MSSTLLKRIKPCERPYIFISYSAKDKEIVYRDVYELQLRGWNVWLDERNLDKTMPSWTQDSLKAIEGMYCELGILYVSEYSLCSEKCYREMSHANAEETKRNHFNKPVKFIAVEVENIGDIVKYGEQISERLKSSDIPYEERQSRMRCLSMFISEHFNENNERLRIKPCSTFQSEEDYYKSMEEQFFKSGLKRTGEDKHGKPKLYRQAVERMQSAKMEMEFVSLAREFRTFIDSIGNDMEFTEELEDALKREKECIEKGENLRKDAIYASALSMMDNDTVEGYAEAMDVFKQIPEWKDARFKIDIIYEKIKALRGLDVEKKEYIYLSYPHDSYSLILKISKLLNDSGYLVKYDEGSGVGKKRLQHIKTIISDSKACICLLTESYVNVQSCRKELDGILDYLLTKNIIIVYIGNKQNILAAYSLGMRTLLEGMKGIELRDETDPKVVQEQLLAMIEDGKIERPIVQFGRYIQTPRSKSIFVRQDKIDPIDWIVLDKCGNELLLISKYALDCQPYDTGGKEITWETCMLRRWLNKEFYEAAFSEEERMRIRETRNENKDNPKYGTKGGNPTRDKVFLLSIEEAEEYFGSDGERRCYLTAYAKKHGAWSSSEGYCWWWLRSPGNESDDAAYVDCVGSLYFYGFWVCNSDYAVRPSLRLHL